MRQIKTWLFLLLIATSGFTLVGCKEEGPAERLGERMDEAGRDAKDAAEEAEKDMKKAVE